MADPKRYRILAVIADPARRNLFETALRRSQWEVEFSATLWDALAQLETDPIPVVVCDHDVTGASWRRLVGHGSLPLVVVASHLADETLWQDVLASGGYDLLPIPFSKGDLFRILSVAASFWRNAGVETTPLVRQAMTA